eukprot:gb/GEZN01009999.1/.p1 GENE.gb/GEZN01009999.1/~~gb/GEZN01009999.1/.p1  ORF type:complete len:126 (+),score=17.41 gb/GEZN01009999.1/:89-466(+)
MDSDDDDNVEAIAIQPEQVAIRAWAHAKYHELHRLEALIDDIGGLCENMCDNQRVPQSTEFASKEKACMTQCVARFFETRRFLKHQLVAVQMKSRDIEDADLPAQDTLTMQPSGSFELPSNLSRT